MDTKTIYGNILADVLNFFESCMPIIDTDSYFDKVIEKGQELFLKYKDTEQVEFVTGEIITVEKEISRIAKEKRKATHI